ncbi:Transient receptor potential-gamma protein [Eumeta japonica]|uniref:Transient receptor potential-gamma protein n=1 Tax=Eumeta variegata TaxID=151549 RepID=A0A4C1SWX8_EUMVA|nr:Transient receptor potential-gamma protein [Eumeta japonica]
MITNPHATDLPRERWDTWDPMLISEGVTVAHGDGYYEIFFLYVLVLFAFGSGLNQLLCKSQQANDRDFKYQQIMRNLVRRYVTVEQRKAESQGVTEDDVNEIKQDISAFRCELVEILKIAVWIQMLPQAKVEVVRNPRLCLQFFDQCIAIAAKFV